MEQKGNVNREHSSAAEQPAREINEGRIGDLAAIVSLPWYFQALIRKHVQRRIGFRHYLQCRRVSADLSKLDIDGQQDLTEPHIADLTKPDIQRPRLLVNVSVVRIRKAGRMLRFVKVRNLKKPEIGHGFAEQYARAREGGT